MPQGTPDTSHDLGALTAQVQTLSEQVQLLIEHTTFLTERARADAVRQREWEELKADLTPIANDLYLVTVDQMAEVEEHVRLEDIVLLLKRVARNTRNFEKLLDQLESMQDLLTDFVPLSDQVVHSIVEQLDQAERKGYFGLARAGAGVADRVVGAFTEEDMRHLGDDVVPILNTVKSMTRPDVMNLADNIIGTYRQVAGDPDLPTGVFDLLRQMRDPEVRRGLALSLRVLRAVAQQRDVITAGVPQA
jgi:uncharacterized protein YjgD (DUF1641 family)